MSVVLTENPPPVRWREHWEDNGDGHFLHRSGPHRPGRWRFPL